MQCMDKTDVNINNLYSYVTTPVYLLLLFIETTRKAVLSKMSFSDERQRERWFSAMELEVMSSEESGIEAGDEIIVVKSLPWRHDQVNSLIQRLDDKIKNDRSPQAARQSKRRIYGTRISTRCQPLINDSMPAWLFK